MARRKRPRRQPARPPEKAPHRFTARQGQYLAYLHLYRKLHGYGPSEAELARHVGVSPPSAHLMIVRLEALGLVTREPGEARSVRVTVPRQEIPPLGDDDDEEKEKDVADVRGPGSQRTSSDAGLFTLDVTLIDGPAPEIFAGREICRTILIRGAQTLDDLHRAIFEAYDRWDEHFYEFEFGRGPHDPNGRRYVLPEMLEQARGDPTIAGDATKTAIGSLGLEVGRPFGYWFDYGDDWWHRIDVMAIEDKVPRGRYPRVTRRAGESPPQYADEEE